MIALTIPIVPVGQMRPRACIRGRHASTYKAHEQEEREETLIAFLAPHAPAEPLTGQLVMHVRAYLPIPKSMTKRNRAAALAGDLRPTTKPDLDNLLKHLKDCLTQARYWGDDRQVVQVEAGKWYSDRPRWEIELMALDEQEAGHVAESRRPATSPRRPVQLGLMRVTA